MKALTSHQTPFFSKLEGQISNRGSNSPQSIKALVTPGVGRLAEAANLDDLQSGSKLMQELIAISKTANMFSKDVP